MNKRFYTLQDRRELVFMYGRLEQYSQLQKLFFSYKEFGLSTKYSDLKCELKRQINKKLDIIFDL